jgi:GxxExxY protein
VQINEITDRVIGAAIDVHRALGPGLLESAYQTCFAIELHDRGIFFEQEVPLSVVYKSGKIHCAYRMDFLVEKQVVVELKAVEKLGDIHLAQMLTYLKLSGCKVGLIFNFNADVLIRGTRRVVLGLREPQRILRTPR